MDSWWDIEALVHYELTGGRPLEVDKEVRGEDVAQRRMHQLYTTPELSFDAAHTLNQLRAMARSRENAIIQRGETLDHPKGKLLKLSAGLINRISTALENRLLDSFSEVYAASDKYDFADHPRPGSVDHLRLRKMRKLYLCLIQAKISSNAM